MALERVWFVLVVRLFFFVFFFVFIGWDAPANNFSLRGSPGGRALLFFLNHSEIRPSCRPPQEPGQAL